MFCKTYLVFLVCLIFASIATLSQGEAANKPFVGTFTNTEYGDKGLMYLCEGASDPNRREGVYTRDKSKTDPTQQVVGVIDGTYDPETSTFKGLWIDAGGMWGRFELSQDPTDGKVEGKYWYEEGFTTSEKGVLLSATFPWEDTMIDGETPTADQCWKFTDTGNLPTNMIGEWSARIYDMSICQDEKPNDKEPSTYAHYTGDESGIQYGRSFLGGMVWTGNWFDDRESLQDSSFDDDAIGPFIYKRVTETKLKGATWSSTSGVYYDSADEEWEHYVDEEYNRQSSTSDCKSSTSLRQWGGKWSLPGHSDGSLYLCTLDKTRVAGSMVLGYSDEGSSGVKPNVMGTLIGNSTDDGKKFSGWWFMPDKNTEKSYGQFEFTMIEGNDDFSGTMWFGATRTKESKPFQSNRVNYLSHEDFCFVPMLEDGETLEGAWEDNSEEVDALGSGTDKRWNMCLQAPSGEDPTGLWKSTYQDRLGEITGRHMNTLAFGTWKDEEGSGLAIYRLRRSDGAADGHVWEKTSFEGMTKDNYGGYEYETRVSTKAPTDQECTVQPPPSPDPEPEDSTSGALSTTTAAISFAALLFSMVLAVVFNA